MKLKKMKKALKNLEKGAVTVSKKDKKYDITECPDKWDDREIVDSYNTEGKNGGITLILGEKSGKKNKDSDSNDIDDSIAKLQRDLNSLADDENPDDHEHKKHHNNDKDHKKDDHSQRDRVDRKADELIRNSRKNDDEDERDRSNRRNSRNNRNNNDNRRRSRLDHNQRRDSNQNVTQEDWSDDDDSVKDDLNTETKED